MTFARILVAVALWASLGALIFGYLGYPVLVRQLARWLGRRQGPPSEPSSLPTVSLLIVAHNEEKVIAARVANALETDYPADRLDVVIASDGSTDRTGALVAEHAARGVRLLAYETRRGKAATIAAAAKELAGDIVVFSDANTFLDASAVRRLARWFEDPTVGVVCGRLILTDPVAGRNVDGLYWRFEVMLRAWEAQINALIGANGAVYAVRRSFLSLLPSDTLLDDLVLPLLVRLRAGDRTVYEPEAVAVEETPSRLRAEFHRRVRIAIGGFQTIFRLWSLLDPRQGWIALSFFGHKVLRWLSPFFLLAVLAGSLALWRHPLYLTMFAAQLIGYGIVALGFWLPNRGRVTRVVRLSALFAMVQAAFAVGFVRWALGWYGPAWRRTPR